MAFDTVNRVLGRALKKMGIKERLVVRMEKTLTKTKSRKRTEGNFWMARGIR